MICEICNRTVPILQECDECALHVCSRCIHTTNKGKDICANCIHQ